MLSPFLVEGFTTGFHVGFISLPHGTFKNLLSTATDMEVVDFLLQAKPEKDFNIGPFSTSPFHNWRVNHLGLVKGMFSNKLHLIYNLSAHHSSHMPSLNSLISSEEFSHKYASVDQAIQHIISMDEGAWLSKANISDAFKLLPILPSLWQWHGIKWRGLYYFATTADRSQHNITLFETHTAWYLIAVLDQLMMQTTDKPKDSPLLPFPKAPLTTVQFVKHCRPLLVNLGSPFTSSRSKVGGIYPDTPGISWILTLRCRMHFHTWLTSLLCKLFK